MEICFEMVESLQQVSILESAFRYRVYFSGLDFDFDVYSDEQINELIYSSDEADTSADEVVLENEEEIATKRQKLDQKVLKVDIFTNDVCSALDRTATSYGNATLFLREALKTVATQVASHVDS